jgi:hypothetical protein
MLITKVPELPKDRFGKVILPPHVYKEALKRWGQEYMDENYVMDQPVPKK